MAVTTVAICSALQKQRIVTHTRKLSGCAKCATTKLRFTVVSTALVIHVFNVSDANNSHVKRVFLGKRGEKEYAVRKGTTVTTVDLICGNFVKHVGMKEAKRKSVALPALVFHPSHVHVVALTAIHTENPRAKMAATTINSITEGTR